MDIVGVGYRAELKGKAVAFALGKSHPISFDIPEGIQITVDKQTHLVISGADKAQVGQVAADIRKLRPPDPYKQKGIRITGERLKKKAEKREPRPEHNFSWLQVKEFVRAALGRLLKPKGLRLKLRRNNSASSQVRKLSRDGQRKRVHARVRMKVSGTTERPSP